MKFFIFLVFLIFSLSLLYFANTNASNVFDIKENHQNISNNLSIINGKIKKIKDMVSSSYNSIYIQVNPTQFSQLVDLQKRNKNLAIEITGWIVYKKGKEKEQPDIFLDSFIEWIKKTYFLPKIIPFTGTLSLRGNFSLNCTKPSFKIITQNKSIKNTNQDENISIKLKSLCGGLYGVEEKLFTELIKNISSALLHPYHVFSYTQEYRNVIINNHFYGIYGDAPELDKEYLVDNGLILPDKKNTCIIKVGRFVIPDGKNEKKVPISSRLELLNQKYTDQDIDFIMEIKYGNKKFCREQNKKLLHIINKENPSRKEIQNILYPESFLLRGLLLWNTQNHVSLTHNYLLIYHEGKFSVGFWDVEDFKGCKIQQLSGYWEKNRREYNKIFDIILNWYQKNNPSRITFFQNLIEKHICTTSNYTLFKNKHLKYILMDKLIRDKTSETFFKLKEKNIKNPPEEEIYEEKINAIKNQYSNFELYFGQKSNSQ